MNYKNFQDDFNKTLKAIEAANIQIRSGQFVAYEKIGSKLLTLIACFLLTFAALGSLAVQPIVSSFALIMGILGIISSIGSIINYKKPAIVLTYKGISNRITFASWRNIKAINYMAFSGSHEQLNIKFYHQNNKLGFMIISINDLTESSECIKYAISHFVKVNQANGNMDIY